MTNLVYMHGNIEVIEDNCINYIEKEIDLFMKSCQKAAYVFSVMVSKDLSNYSKEAFQDMVVSSQEVDDLISRINGRLYQELKLVNKAVRMDSLSINFDESDLNYNKINSQMKDYKRTNRVTRISESVITNSVSLILGDAFSSNVVDFIFSKAKIGEKVLANNNHNSQAERFQKEIYRHIEGALINIKTKLRNELLINMSIYINKHDTGISAAI